VKRKKTFSTILLSALGFLLLPLVLWQVWLVAGATAFKRKAAGLEACDEPVRPEDCTPKRASCANIRPGFISIVFDVA